MSMKDGNFKIRCIDDGGFFTDMYTKDKVYDVINNFFVTDNGCINSDFREGFVTIEEFNDVYFPQFELVEDEQPYNVQIKQFTLDNIKPCMVVELRDGTLCMAMAVKNGNSGIALLNKEECGLNYKSDISSYRSIEKLKDKNTDEKYENNESIWV